MSESQHSAVIVRQADVSDADAIAAVHTESTRAGYSSLYGPKTLKLVLQTECEDWIEKLRESGTQAKTVLVADHKEHGIVGFVLFGPDQKHQGDYEIEALFVRSDCWRQGVGTQLLEEAIHAIRTKGIPRVLLLAHAWAPRARTFYEKSGFVETNKPQIPLLLAQGELPIPLVEYALNL
jgi:GNAT superfamily N-acetyltransferase